MYIAIAMQIGWCVPDSLGWYDNLGCPNAVYLNVGCPNLSPTQFLPFFAPAVCKTRHEYLSSNPMVMMMMIVMMRILIREGFKNTSHRTISLTRP